MANQPVKLSQFSGVKVTNQSQSLADVENLPLVIEKASLTKGDFGTYVDMTAKTVEGAIVQIRTYAPAVVTAITAAIEADCFPVEATFKNNGRKWVIE